MIKRMNEDNHLLKAQVFYPLNHMTKRMNEDT
jgi:hypothetical protein